MVSFASLRLLYRFVSLLFLGFSKSPIEFTQPGSLPSNPSTKYTKVTHPDVPENISAGVQEVLDRGSRYILPVYARHPFVLSHGKGAYLWDTDERRYLDFSAGIAVNALGHGDEGVVKVRLKVIILLLFGVLFTTRGATSFLSLPPRRYLGDERAS